MSAHDRVEPRKLPGQQRSRETVERILAAAARIFDEAGHAGATTNDIATAAHVSVGSLYQYFPNKDALLAALAQRHVEDAVEVLGRELAGLLDSAQPLEVSLRRLVDVTVQLNGTWQLHRVIYTDAVRTAQVEAQAERLLGIAVDGVAELLVRAGAGGPDPATTARLIVTTCDAGVHTLVLARPPGPEREAAVDALVALLLRGVCPTP